MGGLKKKQSFTVFSDQEGSSLFKTKIELENMDSGLHKDPQYVVLDCRRTHSV